MASEEGNYVGKAEILAVAFNGMNNGANQEE